RYSDLVRQEAEWQGVPAGRVLVAPGLAESTYDEALALRALAQQHGWQSILVVTDPYHTRRARLIFRHAFRGTGIAVTVRPVEPAEYDPEAWWHTVDGLRDTWTEWLKLGMYVAGQR
ncbi:MAG: YdcF family protein, partial [Anaerolineae bacterium]